MENLKKFLNEINETNSSVEKQNILKKHIPEKFIQRVLFYTYNPFIQFNVTSKNVEKFKKNKNYKTQEFKEYKCMFKLLDDLTERKITGHKALKSVNEFKINKEIFYLILDKNLKIRVNAATINKVYKSVANKDTLIPVFEPVLSYKFDPHFNKLDKSWFISQKMDGTRCLIHVKGDSKKAYSRSGKELFNVNIILDCIPKINENVFLDGELVYIENGQENFKKTIEIVRKSKGKADTSKLYYKVFDIIPEEDFFNCKGEKKFSERYKTLKTLFKGNKRVKVLEQTIYSPEDFEKMKTFSNENGWEGLMLRKNENYKGKRTRDLAKVKSFQDEEFLVKETINNKIRFINEESGLEETVDCLAAIIIEVGGVDVKVGSGFSKSERILYYNNPEKIIGHKVTVKYFQETEDGSLRFPVFKGIRDYE